MFFEPLIRNAFFGEKNNQVQVETKSNPHPTSSSQRSHPSPPGPGTSGAGGRCRRVFQVVLEAQWIAAEDSKGMTQLTQCFADEFRTGKSLQLAF